MPALSTTQRHDKLETLAREEGYPGVDELLEATVLDSVSPGICTNPGCEYTCEVEPDQREGWCEVCDSQTVVAAGVLGCII